MTQATKFYLPNFKTGYPFAKLYTYISGTDTPAQTYWNTNGAIHNNPITMDENGETTLYIDKDIVYRYVLLDQDNNLIYDYSNIKQLNGEKGDPGGPQGEKGLRGKKGVQGFSGDQGPVGLKGAKGDKGLPYYTAIEVSTTQTINLPGGLEEVWITATGAGGAGACWSPFVFLCDQEDTNADAVSSPITFTPLVKEVDSGAVFTTNNKITMKFRQLNVISMLPGSGFPGKSVYRYKIVLDPKIENVLKVFPGTGGTASNTTLNGNSGTDTLIYLNDQLILSLKGGLGGFNSFPKSNANEAEIPPNKILRLNIGYKNGIIIWQPATPNRNNQLSTPYSSLFSYNTTYRRNVNNSSVVTNIQISMYALNQYVDPGQTTSKAYPLLDNAQDCIGGNTIFGNKWSIYPNRIDPGNSGFDMRNSVKIGDGLQGWGAGGDVLFNPSTSASFYPGAVFSKAGGPSQLTFFNKDEIKEAYKDYMAKFNYFDSVGVGTTPVIDNNDSAFEVLDQLQNDIDTSGNYAQYKGPGWYNIPSLAYCTAAFSSTAVGGSGVNGFVLVEYGDIIEHLKSEAITA